MNPEELRAFVSENIFYVLLFNFVLSLLFGSIALVVGIRRGKRNLGIIGLIVTTIIGIPSWVLGMISSVVFITVIIVKSKSAKDAEPLDSHTL